MQWNRVFWLQIDVSLKNIWKSWILVYFEVGVSHNMCGNFSPFLIYIFRVLLTLGLNRTCLHVSLQTLNCTPLDSKYIYIYNRPMSKGMQQGHRVALHLLIWLEIDKFSGGWAHQQMNWSPHWQYMVQDVGRTIGTLFKNFHKSGGLILIHLPFDTLAKSRNIPRCSFMQSFRSLFEERKIKIFKEKSNQNGGDLWRLGCSSRKWERNKESMNDYERYAAKATRIQHIDIMGSDLSRTGFCTSLREWMIMVSILGGISTNQYNVALRALRRVVPDEGDISFSCFDCKVFWRKNGSVEESKIFLKNVSREKTSVPGITFL